jgi:hypothetical protein
MAADPAAVVAEAIASDQPLTTTPWITISPAVFA